MQYHESTLADFSGLLQIDMHSNAFLNLTLKDVMGSIHGTLTSNNFTQVLQVSVGGQLHQQVEKRLKVVGLVSCHPNAQISVTLRPYGGKFFVYFSVGYGAARHGTAQRAATLWRSTKQ